MSSPSHSRHSREAAMSHGRLHMSYSLTRDNTRPSAVPCSYSWGLQPWCEKGKAAFPPGGLSPKQIAAFTCLEKGKGAAPSGLWGLDPRAQAHSPSLPHVRGCSVLPWARQDILTEGPESLGQVAVPCNLLGHCMVQQSLVTCKTV